MKTRPPGVALPILDHQLFLPQFGTHIETSIALTVSYQSLVVTNWKHSTGRLLALLGRSGVDENSVNSLQMENVPGFPPEPMPPPDSSNFLKHSTSKRTMKRPRRVRFRTRPVDRGTALSPPLSIAVSGLESDESIDGSHPTVSAMGTERPVSRVGTSEEVEEKKKLGAEALEELLVARDTNAPLLPALPSQKTSKSSRRPSETNKQQPVLHARPAPAFDHPTTRRRLSHLLDPDPSSQPSLHPLTREQMSALRKNLLKALDSLPSPSSSSESYPTNPTDLLRVLESEQQLYSSALAEVIRESTVSMRERGLLLHEIRERYRRLFEEVPRHLAGLYGELGKLRGEKGNLGIGLRGVLDGLEAVQKGLSNLKVVEKTGKVVDSKVLEQLASIKEKEELRRKVHELEADRDGWVRLASGLGHHELHLRADSLRGLFCAFTARLCDQLLEPLEASRGLVAELLEMTADLAPQTELALTQDLDILKTIMQESSKLSEVLRSHLESKGQESSSAANAAALFALKDLQSGSVTLRSWVAKMKQVVLRKGGDPKRAKVLLGKIRGVVEQVESKLEKINLEHPAEKDSNPDLDFADIWISQQEDRLLSRDGKKDAVAVILNSIESLLSKIDTLSLSEAEDGVSLLNTSTSVSQILVTRRELANSASGWSAALHPVVAFLASRKDGQGRPLVDGREAGARVHSLLVELTNEVQSYVGRLEERCGEVWREMCRWSVVGGSEPLESLCNKVSLVGK